ncbi:MAG: hypothetical protein ACRCTL_11760 [Pseudomonas sp.]
MRALLFCLSLLPLSSALAASLPEDVGAFIERREACEHFLGEEAYDEERRVFLEEQINRHCAEIDEQLAHLRQVHAGDPLIQRRLQRYEPLQTL